MYYTKEKQKKY